MTGTRVAAVDCGTNAVRLLLADVGEDGLAVHARAVRLVRLGEGVDATGEFAPQALRRLGAALDEYASAIASYGPKVVRFVATSAARDVRNRDAFVRGVRERLGVAPEILTGEQEAAYSYAGARSVLGEAADPVLVTDVGGGSTELATGTGMRLDRAVSLDVGSVRLRERFLASDPATADQIDAATRFTDALLDGAGIGGVSTWVCAGGTATTVSALAQDLPAYDSARVHGSRLAVTDLDAVAAGLLRLGTAGIMRRFGYVPRLRAEVIGAGALICARLAHRVGRPMIVSEADILDGVALAAADPA